MTHEVHGRPLILLLKVGDQIKCIRLLLHRAKKSPHQKDVVGGILKMCLNNYCKKDDCDLVLMVLAFLGRKHIYPKLKVLPLGHGGQTKK